MDLISGRSSGFHTLLAAFPSRFNGTVARRMLKAFLFSYNRKGGVTAAVPLPIFTGFPVRLKST
jgi:hypothetical protein